MGIRWQRLETEGAFKLTAGPFGCWDGVRPDQEKDGSLRGEERRGSLRGHLGVGRLELDDEEPDEFPRPPLGLPLRLRRGEGKDPRLRRPCRQRLFQRHVAI